ncbi:MAG: hypothetical protein AB7I27_14780 [Bacteriovoracaceae bacterium]
MRKILIFTLYLGCSSQKKFDLDPRWKGQDIEILKNHPEFSKMPIEYRGQDRIYKKFGKFQTKGRCAALGGCDWIPDMPDCYFYFSIKKNQITHFKADKGCYSEMYSPKVPSP